MGWNSQPTRAVIFEDAEVPAENLIGSLGQVQVRLGQVRLGQVRLGQAKLGQAGLGWVRLGQVSDTDLQYQAG